uniref:Multidrug and toxin extrusion protein n=1 Tax=Macrostomum lignano TaxID=282301 RepID=A0A1I8HYF4_9PLAT
MSFASSGRAERQHEASLGLDRVSQKGGYGTVPEGSTSYEPRPDTVQLKLLSFTEKFGQRFFPLGYWKEFREIGKLHLPSFLTCFFQIFLQTISVIMCGHLSKEQLDAAALACTLINVAGLGIGLGLSTGCDTYFAQTYGSAYRKRVGLYLQRSLIVMYMFLIPVYCLHLNIKPLLLLLGQDPVVSDMASQYILIFMPGVFFDYTFLVLARYLQTQNRVYPPLICAFIGNVFNAVSQYIAIYVLGFQYEASAACQAASLFVMCACIIAYIRVSGVYEDTWDGWTIEALYDIGGFVRLAVPGLMLVALEEIGTFVAGSISTLQLAAQGIVFQAAVLSYMVSLGMSIAVNIRVGQHIGAKQIEKAKHTYKVAVTMILTTSTILCILFSTCQSFVANLFTSDPVVRDATAELMTIYAPFPYVDGLSATASGVLKGSGRQFIGAVVNLIAYYAVAIPIGIPLSLLTKMEIRGFWVGLLIGLSFETVVFWIIIWRTNWEKEVLVAASRVAGTKAAKTSSAPLDAENASLLPRQNHIRRASRIYSTPYESDIEFDVSRPAKLPPLRPVLIRRCVTWLCLLMFMVAAIVLRAYQDVYLSFYWRELCLLQPLNASIGVNLTYCGAPTLGELSSVDGGKSFGQPGEIVCLGPKHAIEEELLYSVCYKEKNAVAMLISIRLPWIEASANTSSFNLSVTDDANNKPLEHTRCLACSSSTLLINISIPIDPYKPFNVKIVLTNETEVVYYGLYLPSEFRTRKPMSPTIYGYILEGPVDIGPATAEDTRQLSDRLVDRLVCLATAPAEPGGKVRAFFRKYVAKKQ